MQEIKKKILFDPKNNLFKPEEDHYKPIKIDNAFSSNYVEYKSNGNIEKSLSLKDYLNMIRPYLSDIINDYKTQGEQEIHLMVAINFFSSKDSEETCTMYSRSENIEVMMGSETDEIIEELFDSFERGSEFVFDSVNSLY